MKKSKRITALFLATVIMLTGTFSVSAASGEKTGYSSFAKLVDKGLGLLHDGLFAALGFIKTPGIPTVEEYTEKETPYFYEGTDGTASGNGWWSGFAKGSIVPVEWRYNANGEKDPSGYCFNKPRTTGGYQHLITRMYTEQFLSGIILSNGSDANNNGIKDLIIFMSADGVGITSAVCRKMRKAAEEALAPLGVKSDDILAFNVSASHGHNCLDIQGMNLATLFNNKFNIFNDTDSGLSADMENALCTQAASIAKTAYQKLEKGQLYYFETDKTDGVHDKADSGVKTQNYFSCFFFDGENGTKTVLADIGAHPTGSGYETNEAGKKSKLLCADYPYFIAMAMEDAGYNLVFTQGAEALITSPSLPYSEASKEWAEKQSLSREEWIKRYGEKFTNEFYEDDGAGEANYIDFACKGYMLAHHIIDSIPLAKAVEPDVNIKNKEVVIGLEYGLMYWGAVSGILGVNPVKYPASETRYGIMVEIGYMEFGSDVVILTAPGELSPALAYGSAEDYTGKTKWEGEQSWTGESWNYPTLESMVREATDDSDKRVVIMGITNDAIGYSLPDTMCSNAFLSQVLFYNGENGDDMLNSLMLTVSNTSASEFMRAYEDLLK